MDNHIHLLIYPARGESLSRIMQWILSVFAIRFNRHFNMSGHVWYDRFKSVVVGGLRQFVHAYSYITENPVKAGLVSEAETYQYGSSGIRRRGLLGVIGPPGLLVRLLFGEETVGNLLSAP